MTPRIELKFRLGYHRDPSQRARRVAHADQILVHEHLQRHIVRLDPSPVAEHHRGDSGKEIAWSRNPDARVEGRRNMSESVLQTLYSA